MDIKNTLESAVIKQPGTGLDAEPAASSMRSSPRHVASTPHGGIKRSRSSSPEAAPMPRTYAPQGMLAGSQAALRNALTHAVPHNDDKEAVAALLQLRLPQTTPTHRRNATPPAQQGSIRQAEQDASGPQRVAITRGAPKSSEPARSEQSARRNVPLAPAHPHIAAARPNVRAATTSQAALQTSASSSRVMAAPPGRSNNLSDNHRQKFRRIAASLAAVASISGAAALISEAVVTLRSAQSAQTISASAQPSPASSSQSVIEDNMTIVPQQWHMNVSQRATAQPTARPQAQATDSRPSRTESALTSNRPYRGDGPHDPN